MKSRVIRWLVAGAVVTGATVVAADSSNPPTARTGAPAVAPAPAEGLCTGCHSGNATNSGGSIQLINAPLLYREGRTYPITLRLTSSQTAGSSGRMWGLEVTAVRNSDGTGAGTFATITGQGTGIGNGSGNFSTRRYVRHVAGGTHDGQASPAEWTFNWTAPATDIGSITFFFSGVAADGSGDESGDWVYFGSQAAADTTTPTIPTTWGQIKQRWR